MELEKLSIVEQAALMDKIEQIRFGGVAEVQDKEGKQVRVSTIEITLDKK